MVDLYSASRANQVLVYTSPVLADATHTLKVRVTGTKNGSASDSFVVADRVDVTLSTAPPPPPPPPDAVEERGRARTSRPMACCRRRGRRTTSPTRVAGGGYYLASHVVVSGGMVKPGPEVRVERPRPQPVLQLDRGRLVPGNDLRQRRRRGQRRPPHDGADADRLHQRDQLAPQPAAVVAELRATRRSTGKRTTSRATAPGGRASTASSSRAASSTTPRPTASSTGSGHRSTSASGTPTASSAGTTRSRSGSTT